MHQKIKYLPPRIAFFFLESEESFAATSSMINSGSNIPTVQDWTEEIRDESTGPATIEW